MTVVIGVVTVAEVGVVTLTVAIGVLTATVAETVTGGVGADSAGREKGDTGSVECDWTDASSALDELTDAAAAARLEPCVAAATERAPEAASLLGWRGAN